MAEASSSFRQQQPPPELEATSIIEYLESDPRPTFIVDVTRSSSIPSAAVVYRNVPFRAFEDSLDLAGAKSHSTEIGNAAVAFFVWAYGQSADGFNFRNTLWSGFTIKNRWRIISGFVSRDQQRSNTTPSHPSYIATVDDLENNAVQGRTNYSQQVSASTCFYPDLQLPFLNFVRTFDWHHSPIGPIEQWPVAFQRAVQFTLSIPAPSAVWLGPERHIVYNEAFCPLIGSWHPKLMGRSLRTEWDFWPHYEAICLEVEATRQAVSVVAAEGPLFERDGFLQETFFTFNYIPVFDEAGEIIAICDQATDVTQDIFARGRISTLQRTSDIATAATTQRNLWDTTLRILQDSNEDVPLATIFLHDDMESSLAANGQEGPTEAIHTWISNGSFGFPIGQKLTLDSWNASDPAGFQQAMHYALSNAGPTALRSGSALYPKALLGNCGYKSHPYTTLILCPLRLSSGTAVGCLILGINPLRPYDDEFEHFVRVMARQIEDAHKLVVFIEAQAKLLRETMDQAAIEQRILAEQLQQQTRRAQEAALRFLNFANQAQVGVFVLNTDGSIQYCNDTWRNLIGLTQEEAANSELKHRWRPHIHPDDRLKVEEQWELLVQGKTQNSFEFRVVRNTTNSDAESQVVYLRTSSFPEPGEDGKMKTITGIMADRSVEVAHQQITNARIEAALEEKRAQEYFMDMTSHEMRNPLNAMIQCAEEALEMLAELQIAPDPDGIREAVLKDCTAVTNTILYCGRHQKELIDDVLTVSKLDANLLSICPVPACPESIVKQAMNIFQMNMKAADIKWEAKVDSTDSTDILDSEHDTVLMDPGRVLQVLLNLISNAVKFMKDQSERRLTVTLAATTDQVPLPDINYISSGRERAEPTVTSPWGQTEPVYVHFTIKDTGPGLTEQEMQALFARFKQASPRTHAQYGGSGLGLFISRELTELHGGAIGVASTVGQGSTFAFYIKGRRIPASSFPPKSRSGSITSHRKQRSVDIQPRIPLTTPSPPLSVRPSAPKTCKPSKLSAPPPLSGIGILVVEDNIINQQVLERQLRKMGCRVTTANHGQEALDLLQTSTWWRGTSVPAQSPQGDKLRFDIILCDLEMPVMDGKTCVKRIRAWQEEGSLAADIPILPVTGNARVAVDVAREWGFDDVVSKPFSVKSLLPLFQELGNEGGTQRTGA
ncbi:Histidine kinase-, DNA gyrase B-, and HSP90-like ATPase-like protein 1 [Elsinoe fawcettii]|nr:Histidine kinase-, DNA gyrase B-, and HSP90-like ATPase-like protein 1 [Elsinoe fawcettii]